MDSNPRINQVYRTNAGDDGAHGSDAPYRSWFMGGEQV
jgi:hypothetical protein